MSYRVFLYNSRCGKNALGNDMINHQLRHRQPHTPVDDLMDDLDCAEIIAELKNELQEMQIGPEGLDVSERTAYHDDKKVRYICVCMHYRHAAEVLPILCAAAAKHDLVMYDAVTGYTSYRDLVNQPVIQLHERQQAFHHAILKAMKPLRSIRRLIFFEDEASNALSYVVTLNKDAKRGFERRVAEFKQCLLAELHEDERLICEDGCFIIDSKFTSLTYCLEGYKKRSDRRGFADRGFIRTELLHRMSCEEAAKQMKAMTRQQRREIRDRMHFIEMRRKYPNPADRFVASVNITKALLKYPFSVRYCGIGYYGDEILFHIFPEEYIAHSNEVSVLSIQEEDATFILPFVKRHYPYMETRYYNSNYIPWQMMQDIVADMRKVIDLMLTDPLSPELLPYAEAVTLWSLQDIDQDQRYLSDPKEKLACLQQHQRLVITFLQDFIRWAEAQIKCCAGTHAVFNIQGP